MGNILRNLFFLFVSVCFSVNLFADSITFTLSRPSGEGQETYAYRTVSGSAIAGIHFSNVSGEYTFAEGETEHQIEIPVYTAKGMDSWVYRSTNRKFYVESWKKDTYRYESEHTFSPIAVDYARSYSSTSFYSSGYVKINSGDTRISGHRTFNYDLPSFMRTTLPSNGYEYISATGQKTKLSVYFTIDMKEINDGWCDVWMGYHIGSSYTEYYDRDIDLPGSGWAQYVFDGKSYTFYSNYTDITFGFNCHGSGSNDYWVGTLSANVSAYDVTSPSVKNMYVNTEQPYISGEEICISMKFDELVKVSSSDAEKLYAKVRIANNEYSLAYFDGSGTNTLMFKGKVDLNESQKQLTGISLQSFDNKYVTDINGNVANAVSSTSFSNNTFVINNKYPIVYNLAGGYMNNSNYSSTTGYYVYGYPTSLLTNADVFLDGYYLLAWTKEGFKEYITEIGNTEYGEIKLIAAWFCDTCNQCGMEPQFVTTEASCVGNADGAIRVNVANSDIIDYTYEWNTGETTPYLENVVPGIYSVMITKPSGCTITVADTVPSKPAMQITIDSLRESRCDTATGAVFVSVDRENVSYKWSNDEETECLLAVPEGSYTLTVTDEKNCQSMLAVEVGGVRPKQPEISLVTVSEESGMNLVVWLKEETDLIDYYTIYRENDQANVYDSVGYISYDDLSVFEDIDADPTVRAWRYKISTTDVCGNESEMSNHHKTMHLTKNAGIEGSGENNLIWDEYEGLDFSTYVVYRKHKVNDEIVVDMIATLPSTVTSYTDKTPAEQTMSYYVAIKLPEEIDPQTQFMKSESGPFTLAISNIAELENEAPNAIHDVENAVFVYVVNHAINVKNADEKDIVIYDNNGRVITHSGVLQTPTTNTSNITQFNIPLDGIYVVKVGNESFVVIVK